MLPSDDLLHNPDGSLVVLGGFVVGKDGIPKRPVKPTDYITTNHVLIAAATLLLGYGVWRRRQP